MSSRARKGDAKRVVQQQLARERRRRRALLASAVAVAVLLAAGVAGWATLSAQRGETAAALTVPTGAVDEGTGFAVGSGPVKIDVYEDFMCPVCGVFEQQAEATLATLVADGKVTVVYHPIAILDRYSTTEYSTRAAAAAAAAAVGGRFTAFHQALFAQQPAEGGSGLSDDQLIAMGRSAGLGEQFATAVRDRTYRSWATRVTDTASARGVTGTPTVLVAGRKLENPDRRGVPTPATLSAAVEAAAG